MTIKTQYFHDPKCPTRVMTLVFYVGKEQTQYGYSINRPSRWVGGGMYERTACDGKFFAKGDQFNKQRGRQIALGRLTAAPLIADLAGRDPLTAIMETLRDASENSIVRRIANKIAMIAD